MVKTSPLSLLRQSLSDAQIKNGMINTKTIDQDCLLQIIKKKLYDHGVDYQILWDTVFSKSLKVNDFQNRVSRPFSDEEKKAVAQSIHDVLKNIPYKYDFYYRLPDDYPGEFKKLAPNIEIKVISEQLVNKLTPAITGTGLVKALNEAESKKAYS